MKNDTILELLSVMSYPITEEIFLTLMGSRTDWDELVQNNLEKTDEMGYILRSDEYNKTQSVQDCHKKIYHKYIKYLQNQTQITYSNIYHVRDFVIKASTHSLQGQVYNELVEVICKHYKCYIFWNIKKDEIDEYLTKVKDFTTDSLRAWIDYYTLFQDIIPHPKASEHEEKLKDIYERTSLLHLKGDILNTLGIIALRENQIDLASTYYQECLDMSKEAGNLELVGKSLLNLSIVMKKKEHLFEALTYIKQSLSVLDQLSDKYYYFLAEYNFLTLLLEINDDLAKVSNLSSEIIENIYEDYPDLVRNFSQLKCRLAIKEKKYQEYFGLKIIGIICANSLYVQDYFNEFFELLNQIAMMVKESINIHHGLTEIIEMYKKLQMDDEVQFFTGVQRLLDGEESDFDVYKQKINNPSLQELYDDFLWELQLNLKK